MSNRLKHRSTQQLYLNIHYLNIHARPDLRRKATEGSFYLPKGFA